MLLEAIFGIIAISIVFCCCTFCCYLFHQFLFIEDKSEVKPEPEVWEAMHYYDPLPQSCSSPPDTIFKPTPYTFKLQNGNGVYAAPLSHSMPHAVINPAVLQYPPGHVLDQQRKTSHLHHQHPADGVPPKHQTLVQSMKENETKRSSRPTRRRSRSRSPSPVPRGTKNVWSTNSEFLPTQNYHQQTFHRSYQQQQHYQVQQQPHIQRQYVQLTQDHYPVHERQQKHHSNFPPQEFLRSLESNFQQESGRNHRRHSMHQQHQHQSKEEQQYEPFVASSHATNAYTNHRRHSQISQIDYEDLNERSRKEHKHIKTHRSRHKVVAS